MGERRHLDLLATEKTVASAGESPPAATSWFAEELERANEPAFDTSGALVLYLMAAVRFEASRLVEHDSGDTTYARGERVVCATPEGALVGEVVVPSRRVLRAAPPTHHISRRATSADVASEAELREREQAVWRVARDAARALQLPVKVVRAEALQAGARFVVQFASDSKVSFRDWLRAVGKESRERVELRQIGMRDSARLIGGVGPCGLQLCCNTFLSDFTPVGMKMAKTQGLTLNPQKVSGLCGRLLCCLVYEEAHYRAGREAMPEPGDRVATSSGEGRVTFVDVLQMTVSVALDAGGTQTFAATEVIRRRDGAGEQPSPTAELAGGAARGPTGHVE
jgi:cell fate regulator YaaT (PSP1 superfamily)